MVSSKSVRARSLRARVLCLSRSLQQCVLWTSLPMAISAMVCRSFDFGTSSPSSVAMTSHGRTHGLAAGSACDTAQTLAPDAYCIHPLLKLPEGGVAQVVNKFTGSWVPFAPLPTTPGSLLSPALRGRNGPSSVNGRRGREPSSSVIEQKHAAPTATD